MDYSKIQRFYNCLQDEESRYIYMCRWQYLVSGDETYLCKMVKGTDKYFHKRIFTHSHNVRNLHSEKDKDTIPVVLYGAGGVSEAVLGELYENKIKPVSFCDSNTALVGKSHFGLPVISKEELLDMAFMRGGGCGVVVSTYTYQIEICKDLLATGFPEENLYILDDTQYDCELQYFGPEFMHAVPDEIFIDGGAFDGGTVRDFVRFANSGYKCVYAFEPHPESFLTLKNNIEKWGYEHIAPIPKAVWNSGGVMDFLVYEGQIAAQGSRLTISPNENSQKTPVGTIDSVVGNDYVTFIKLDVEGAELNALLGAKETINRCKPKLAVSLYHKTDDIIDIPVFLTENWPDYRFFIRHHRDQYHPYPYLFNETVLYAT